MMEGRERVRRMRRTAVRGLSRWLPLITVLCSSCTSGIFESKQPVQQTYVIAPAPPQEQSSPHTEAQAPADAAIPLAVDLAVARPLARPGLDTERIAVLYPDRRLDYYAASRWSATAEVVVQSLLVESLRNSGRLHSVQSDLSAFGGEYLLQTELRDFQAEYADKTRAPLVRVTLVCTLGHIHGRQPLATYSASANATAAGNSMRAVVAAFEGAYAQAARSIVNDTLAALAAAVTRQSATEPDTHTAR
jgi:cholesterol transport system auxiliary component